MKIYSIKRIPKSEIYNTLSTLKKIASHSEYSACTYQEIKVLNHVFAAYYGDKIVGFGGLVRSNGKWGLRICAVLPQHRGHGLQRKLIKARVDFLINNYPSVKNITVWVSIENAPSMNNLKKEGFVPIEEKIHYRAECIKMRKIL